MSPEQRLFNEAWEHVIEQGCASMLPDTNTCRYLTHEGLSCAFAPAIENYRPAMEGKGASDLLIDHADSLHEWVRDVNVMFAIEVQKAHDNAARQDPRQFITCFENIMRMIAAELVFIIFWGLAMLVPLWRVKK